MPPNPPIPPSKGTSLSQFTLDTSGSLGGPPWLARRREEAFERFSSTALPSESEEVWRYSGIDSFDLEGFSPVPPASADAETSDLAAAGALARTLGPRSALVVTRDGLVSAVEVSEDVVDGEVRIAALRAERTERLGSWALGELAAPRDAFGELHDAFLVDALLIEVAEKAELAEPVVIVHMASVAPVTSPAGVERGAACFPRTLVRVGRSGDAGVVEVFVGSRPVHGEGLDVRGGLDDPVAAEDGAPGHLVVPVTELAVHEDARLRYASLQVLDPSAVQIALQASRVEQGGSLRSFTAGLGGRYARVRTDSDVCGQGAETSLLAAYLGTDHQVHDFRTLQDHHAPRTRSELLFKGAVSDKAHSVYSGLIRIARGARGSDAFQTNHNLVLSEGAHADSVPNLDIDENDVRCSHASTVGPVDEEQLYYLESRGIEPAVAERLIVLGFFADLAARAPFEGVGRFVERTVGDRLARRLLSGEPGPLGQGEPDG